MGDLYVIEENEDKPHEECGVFGIYSACGEDVAPDIYNGLIALQHRGQESAGIAVSDTTGSQGNVMTKKGMGLVNEVFPREELLRLKGNIGVGHVRYSTTGGSAPENAQPIAMKYVKGSLAIVHNGNLVNAEELKREQLLRGQAHYTTSDTEVLAYEIVSARLRSTSVEQAVYIAAGNLKGGFACVIMSPRKLIGVRDPLGLKPLVLGKRGGSYIFASESAVILSVGGVPVRDVRPGEIITITEAGLKSDVRLCGDKLAHCVFEYIYFAREDSVIDGIEVREARFRSGRSLARTSPVEADLVTGVPDSGLVAAEGYSYESGIPFSFIFHKNTYVGRSFIKPTDKERKNAVTRKLGALRSAVKGKRIVLIDDSIVRGTTMKQIILMLREAGAAEVHVRISSPPFLFPCFYGTDVPDSRQLIAAGSVEREICERIGADSLAYLRIEEFEGILEGLPVCRACFDGQYPVR